MLIWLILIKVSLYYHKYLETKYCTSFHNRTKTKIPHESKNKAKEIHVQNMKQLFLSQVFLKWEKLSIYRLKSGKQDFTFHFRENTVSSTICRRWKTEMDAHLLGDGKLMLKNWLHLKLYLSCLVIAVIWKALGCLLSKKRLLSKFDKSWWTIKNPLGLLIPGL